MRNLGVAIVKDSLSNWEILGRNSEARSESTPVSLIFKAPRCIPSRAYYHAAAFRVSREFTSRTRAVHNALRVI